MKNMVAIVLLVLMISPFAAQATLPVEATLTGCVVDNTFYNIYASADVSKAYAMSISPPVDLKPYEGKAVRMSGWLNPGNRFTMRENTAVQVVGDTCDAASRKAIEREYMMNYRVQAGRAARKGNFDEALAVIDKAFKIDPGDCDTYTDRAGIYCMKNDFAAAARDVSVIKTGVCSNAAKANYLLLEDLGKCLEGKGKRQEALEAYRLAYGACIGRGDPGCKQPISGHIKRLDQ